jgi:hypothetical protein
LLGSESLVSIRAYLRLAVRIYTFINAKMVTMWRYLETKLVTNHTVSLHKSLNPLSFSLRASSWGIGINSLQGASGRSILRPEMLSRKS